jgi:hypothetical protein
MDAAIAFTCSKPPVGSDAWRVHCSTHPSDMVHKRARFPSLAPSEEASWLLVENQFTELVFAKEFPPRANPINIMIEALAASLAKGWEIECLPGNYALYYCRKGADRHCVYIGSRPPRQRLRRPEDPAAS